MLIIETKGFFIGTRLRAGAGPSVRRVLSFMQSSRSIKWLLLQELHSIRKQVVSVSVPSAFLNLLAPKDRYPIDPKNVDGALGVLKWLLPNNVIRLNR